jgi:hypothetical protein
LREPCPRNKDAVVIEGVTLSTAAVMELISRLQAAGHLELAQRIGIALDRDLPSLRLYPGDHELVLEVLDAVSETPSRLRPLRDALTVLPDER